MHIHKHWLWLVHVVPRAARSMHKADWLPRLCFYQTRSAWSRDQGSNKNHSPAYNFTPTVTKFCVMWEGLSLPHDTKFGNCRCKIVDSRSFHSWSLIHGLRWSGLIKVGPGLVSWCHVVWTNQSIGVVAAFKQAVRYIVPKQHKPDNVTIDLISTSVVILCHVWKFHITGWKWGRFLVFHLD